jgi:threonine synthase
MRYISTRGGSPSVSFFDALLNGLAPDGGLYMPESWPRLSPEVLADAATMPYADTAAAVLTLFAGDDLSHEDAIGLTEGAYGAQWANPGITPVRQIGPGDYILELFHGPSLAFKDVAMQLLAGLFDHVLEKRDARLSIICATSGDTGGAAVEALKESHRVDLFVLLPDGRVSDVQRRFMTSSGAENVHALVVDGDFDGAQAIVKALLADHAFSKEVALSPVNSINWARILAQSVYYVTTSCALSSGGPVNFTVPSGNFGDALAGYVAKMIGAPIGKIMIATNQNDGIAKAFETGTYSKSVASTATLSPAMDISVASNFERIVFEALGRDAATLKRLYEGFAQNGSYDIPEAALNALKANFDAFGVDDSETRWALADCYEQTGEVLCPHTAVGWRARFDNEETKGARVLLATAHPAKFSETVEEVLGVAPALPRHCADLFERREQMTKLPASVSAVMDYIRAHKGQRS